MAVGCWFPPGLMIPSSYHRYIHSHYKHGSDGLKPPRTDHFWRRVLALERALKDSVATDLASACQGVLEMRLGHGLGLSMGYCDLMITDYDL